MKQKIDFLRINRNTVIASLEMDYIPSVDEVVVLNSKRYITVACIISPKFTPLKSY